MNISDIFIGQNLAGPTGMRYVVVAISDKGIVLENDGKQPSGLMTVGQKALDRFKPFAPIPDLESLKKNLDWKKAFKAAGLDIKKMSKVLAAVPGEWDGADWVCLTAVAGLYNKMTFFKVAACCDYHGWD